MQIATSTSFSDVMMGTSVGVTPGSYATTSISNIPEGSYYWRARTLNAMTNMISNWVQFGTDGVMDFEINSTLSVQVLVVGGGAGGGVKFGGGGGAGGYQYNAAFTVSPQAYPVTVGAGGAAGVNAGDPGGDGGSSTFSTITATGGGGGGAGDSGAGRNGSSGGGGSGRFNAAGGTGTAGQGYDGGGLAGGVAHFVGGGGGGASAAGSNGGAGGSGQGNGGAGIANSISGSSTYYAGGGGGGGEDDLNTVPGAGGAGGGGAGEGAVDTTDPVAGTPNTGGGGGGSGGRAGADSAPGGSGIVIIRCPTAQCGASTGGTITTNGSDSIFTFTASGTFTYATGGAPNIANLYQYKADGVTELSEGSSTAESTVFFKALLNSSSSSNLLKLQVQIATSTSFAGVFSGYSNAVAAGNYATTTIPDIAA
ncbi:MAG: hypothetical protein Q7N50_15175, partial [Armatimonadota bacterium]|nr:hypothetical protein [Armatimonadota bacterium]